MNCLIPKIKYDTFMEWSRTKVFRKRLSKTKEVIEEWLHTAEKPYVAFSGGKDSTCVLHLVREILSDCPAVHFDADCNFPEVDELLLSTPYLITIHSKEKFLDILQDYGIDGKVAVRPIMKKVVDEPIKELQEEYSFGGSAYGLRAEECDGRRKHFASRGHIFRYKNGVLGCMPIAHWRYNDVWAYIVSMDIPYAGTYDRMWDMKEREQRVSYWAGITNLRFGRYFWLKKNYPELWNRLASAIPEARTYV